VSDFAFRFSKEPARKNRKDLRASANSNIVLPFNSSSKKTAGRLKKILQTGLDGPGLDCGAIPKRACLRLTPKGGATRQYQRTTPGWRV